MFFIQVLAHFAGWNDVGYHNPDMITPKIDQLAASGITLNRQYVQPMCTPSRSSLLTGYYPYHIGRGVRCHFKEGFFVSMSKYLPFSKELSILGPQLDCHWMCPYCLRCSRRLDTILILWESEAIKILMQITPFTNCVCRWHLGHCNKAYLPTNRGFDTQYGIYLSGGDYYQKRYTNPDFPYDFFEDDEFLGPTLELNSTYSGVKRAFNIV